MGWGGVAGPPALLAAVGDDGDRSSPALRVLGSEVPLEAGLILVPRSGYLDCFDSHSLAMPRVHRFTKPHDGSDEWVMW